MLQAYLEFFVSPELLAVLIPHLERDSSITYHVINKLGDLRTNTTSEGPNAVTWGVFPGKEIVQPTVVEAISFMAWKVRNHECRPMYCSYVNDPDVNSSQDEAYELGHQWAKLYEADSPSRKVISDMMNKFLLVNVVHNNFVTPNAIFEPFFKAGAEFAGNQSPQPAVNGSSNGHATN